MKLRQHRRAFDNHRLDCENAEQDEDYNYQKNVAGKPQALRPKTLPRLATEMNNFHIRIVGRGNHPEVYLVFLLEIEHNQLNGLMPQSDLAARANLANLEINVPGPVLSKDF